MIHQRPTLGPTGRILMSDKGLFTTILASVQVLTGGILLVTAAAVAIKPGVIIEITFRRVGITATTILSIVMMNNGIPTILPTILQSQNRIQILEVVIVPWVGFQKKLQIMSLTVTFHENKPLETITMTHRIRPM